MIVEEVSALVLRSVDSGENDKLLTLLTEENGRITAYVRGSRSLKSRYFSSVQLFCYSRILLCKKNDFYYVKESELCDNFFSLRESLEKTALAGYVCDAVSYVATEEPSKALFRLTLNTLYAISKSLYPLPHIKAVFEFRLSALIGFMPDISGCSKCGKKDGDFMFDIMNGLLLCDECRKDEENRHPERYAPDYHTANIVCLLNSGAHRALTYILSSPPDRIFSFRLQPEDETLFHTASETYFLNQVDHEFQTLTFYKDVMRNC